MTPKTIDIWAPVEYQKTRSSSGKREEGTITITASTKAKNTGKPVFNKLTISSDVVDEACWSADDRVTLFRAGEALFMLKPQPAGLETLRKVNTSSGNLAITSVAMMRVFYTFLSKGIVKFDAWAEGDCVMFKPRKESK